MLRMNSPIKQWVCCSTFTHQTMLVCICASSLPVSNHVCLCLPTCPWCSVWTPSLAVCNLEPVFSCCTPPIPLLAPLKWQFVKHGPLLALSYASQPFPARLLPSLICPPPLLFTSLVLHPSLTFISIPPEHPASPTVSPSLPVYVLLSFFLLYPPPVIFNLLLSLYYFASLHTVSVYVHADGATLKSSL